MSTLTAKGLNGQLSFDGQLVTITREGFIARSMQGGGTKTIPIRSIGAVQLRPATALVNGFLQFSVSGEVSRSKGRGGQLASRSDENSVIIRKSHMPEIQAFVDAVNAAIANL